MYTVTIIIPVYNAENTIHKTLRSVTKQTLENIEVIVINDGSVDNTYNILRKFDKNDNIRIINQENTGVSITRNRGLDLARGEYVFFLDADDYIEENTINQMYKFAKKNNLDFVACNHKEKNSSLYLGNINENHSFIADSPEEIGRHFFEVFPKSACAKLFKLNIIKEKNIKFPIDMTLGEDKYFTYLFLLNVKKIGKVDDVYYFVQNVNPYSLSKCYVKNMDNIIIKQLDLWNEIIKKYPLVEKEYYKKNIDYRVHLAATYVNNLYKQNCNLSKNKKYRLIKKFLKEYYFLIPSKLDFEKKPKNFMQKITILILKTHNVFFIGTFFYLKEIIKKIRFNLYILRNK